MSQTEIRPQRQGFLKSVNRVLILECPPISLAQVQVKRGIIWIGGDLLSVFFYGFGDSSFSQGGIEPNRADNFNRNALQYRWRECPAARCLHGSVPKQIVG